MTSQINPFKPIRGRVEKGFFRRRLKFKIQLKKAISFIKVVVCILFLFYFHLNLINLFIGSHQTISVKI